jgi:putative transposase
MAIPSRQAPAGNMTAGARTFFISSSIAAKRFLLQSDRSARLLLDVLYHYRAEGRYRLHAFVVMPNHFHTLLTVGPELSIERAVQLIKGGFAFRAGKELGFHPPVWQRGFSEVRVLDIASFEQHVRYTHENPIRARLASSAQEFPFSSAAPGFELDPAPQGLKATSIRPPIGTPEGVP